MGILSAHAQTILKGRVLDANTNTPLAGASILFAGKGGTITDKDGMFSIVCGKTTKITVSFIGYLSHEQFIKNCNDELKI